MKGICNLACLALLLGAGLQAASLVSEEDVRQWLAAWQKREGVERWNLDLRIVRHAKLSPNILGDVEWWSTPGTAKIQLLCAADMQSVFAIPPGSLRYETERVIVHELMHLVIAELYDDGSGSGERWLDSVPGGDARMNAITDNLAVMLLNRHAPGGIPVARYVAGQIDSGPWHPSANVRERVMLQVVRAMNAANEDDVLLLAKR